MSALLRPGDARAGELFTDAAVVAALVQVESVWLAELVAVGVAPAGARLDPGWLVGTGLVEAVAERAEAAGNPAGPLVAILRERLGDSAAAIWLHRGLTSQDGLDTALMLCARAVDHRLRADLHRVLARLAGLAREHRGTPMVARTLTQPAVPYTFGAKAASWLTGLVDAVDDLVRVDRELPAQFGGAAGTLAASVELLAGADDPAVAALGLSARAAERLGLAAREPWHTARAPITRLGAAWTGITGALGRIADDVLVLARPELAELAEPDGRGGSSTMPQKANPVLSVLIRSAALAAPSVNARLALAAAAAVDERPDGAWHLEWPALQELARSTVVAASQAADLLDGLQVFPDRMAANLAAAGDGVRAEQRTMAGLTGRPPLADYDGAAALLVDRAVARAEALLPELT